MSAKGARAAAGAVLVIGATGGVGLTTAQRLSEAGFAVIATCRTAAQAKQLLKSGICKQALRMSLEKPASIDAAFAQLRQQDGLRLAGLVNCAAITQPQPLELASLSDVRRTFEINLFGALHAIQRALPLLRKTQGRIVMVSSTSGSVGVPLLGAYSASKFALEALADVLRRELSGWHIGVSLVIPAGIKTDMIARQLAEIDKALKRLQPGIEAEYARQYRQHRRVIELADKSAVTPEAVGAVVLRALTDASPKARYLCGLPSAATRTFRRALPDSVMDRLFDLVPAGKNQT